MGHRTVAHQHAWFCERATGSKHQWGFTVGENAESATVQVVGRGREAFRHDDGKVTFVKATYEGILTVTHPELLRQTLERGLGRGRAYGCGLLTLAPVN